MADLTGDPAIDNARLVFEANKERAKLGATAEKYLKVLAEIESSKSEPSVDADRSTATSAKVPPPDAMDRDGAIPVPERLPLLSISEYECERRAHETGRAFGVLVTEDSLEDAKILAIAKGATLDRWLDDKPAFEFKGEVLPYTAENLSKVVPEQFLRPVGRRGAGLHAAPHAPPSVGGSLLQAGLRDFSVFRSNISAIRAERARQLQGGQ